MGKHEVDKLMEKWMADAMFRTELRKNPEGALQKTGAQLTAEEWAAFRKIDWGMSDSELKSRISKAM